MKPILFSLGPGGGTFVLGSYATFYLLAWLVAPAIAVRFAARRGIPWRQAAVVYYGAVACGVVGARVLDLFVAGGFYSAVPSRAWALGLQGYSLYGGLAAASLAAIVLAPVVRAPLWRLADASIPGIATGIVLMRTGCFLRGCCFGEPTTLPWGVTYPMGSQPWSHQVVSGGVQLASALAGEMRPVHPTQIYELLAAVVLGALALLLLKLGPPDGVAFLAFAADFTMFRMLNGFMRARVEGITAPGWFYPVLYSGLTIVFVALIAWRFAERRRAADVYP